MRPASVFAGVAFRSALMIMVVFAVVSGVAGFAILKTTQASMSDQLRSSITEDFGLLRDANDTGGEDELVKFIEAAVATRSDKQSAFGLFKLSGRRVAGNVASAPNFRGWGMLPVEASPGGDDHFLGYVEKLDDNIVVAARSQRFLTTEGGNNVIDGGDGNDTINGGGGMDFIRGEGDDDTINGEGGDDTIFGGDGDDTIDGGPGDDVIDGGPGDDTCIGGIGTDTFINCETIIFCP